MLGVTPKRSDDVDLVRPLTDYIKSNFSKPEAQQLSETIASINSTRQRVNSAALKYDGDVSPAIDLYRSYFYMLQQLSSRFPFGRPQGSSFFRRKISSISITFTWYDAFRPHKKGSDVDINFEKASVLFNIATFYSLAGIREDRSSVEGLKRACKHFQLSSGVFAFLCTHPEYESVMTVDLSSHCYRMLSHLMLAQAQACFFEQAVKAKMSAALVAKLARGTSALFTNAFTACDRTPLKEWLEKTNYKWQRHIMYQSRCFLSASHYWQSKAELEGDQYGTEIVQLQSALSIALDARKFEPELIQGLVDSRAKLQDMIQTRLAAAVKDNDSVYHYPLPKQMKEIEQKFVVTATAFDADPPRDMPNAFASLVPMRVHENAAAYMGQLNTIQAAMAREVQEATDLAKMHLASLNLPAALEALEPDQGLPKGVWDRVKETQLKGGSKTLLDLFEQVSQASQEAQLALNQVRATLKKEEGDDQEMRNQFSRKWNRVPSPQITAAFLRDADTVDQYLQRAAQSDREVRAEYQGASEELARLALSQADLSAQLPRAPPSAQQTPEAARLRKMLDELAVLIDSRSAAIKKFEQGVAKENIVSSLIAAEEKVPVEQVFAEERKKFEPLQREVSESLDRQKVLLDEITAANEQFTATRSKNSVASERENVLQSINVAVDKYSKLLANLTEGLKFYGDIIKDYLTPLKQTIDDFVVAREHEKRLLLEQITADLAKFNLHSSNESAHSQAAALRGGHPTVQPAAASWGGDDFSSNSRPSPQPTAHAPVNLYQPAPDMYNSVPASNPNMQFNSADPVYPRHDQSRLRTLGADPHAAAAPAPGPAYGYARPAQPEFFGGAGPYGGPAGGYAYPAQQGGYPQPAAQQFGGSQGSGSGGEWTCPACTFANPARSMVCQMCNTDNPNPAPAQAKPQAGAKPAPSAQGGWRSFFS